jgi:hypothetical protein
MAVRKNDKYEEYTQYAEHCVKMVMVSTDRKSRIIQREMAAEWIRLADAVSSNGRSGQSNGKSEHGLALALAPSDSFTDMCEPVSTVSRINAIAI